MGGEEPYSLLSCVSVYCSVVNLKHPTGYLIFVLPLCVFVFLLLLLFLLSLFLPSFLASPLSLHH